MPKGAQKLPQTQKKLTNIAVVRLKTQGKHFEIACYKNKVVNWREGVEKDINEVIQTDQIFENLEKGSLAKEKDLKKVFNTTDGETICQRILAEGELQVSEKERETQLEYMFRDVVTFIVEKCVNPLTGRPLTMGMVENALKEIHFNVTIEKQMKPQALKAIEALCQAMPDSIARAPMRLRLGFPENVMVDIRDTLKECDAKIEAETKGENGGPCTITFLCDPRHYRELDNLAMKRFVDSGVTLQIVTNIVVKEGGADMASSTVAMGITSTGSAMPSGVPQKASQGGYAGAVVPVPASGPASKAEPQKKKMVCSACNTDFEDIAEYRAHCKSEWHNFNLKRKVKGLEPVPDEEFREIALDIKEGLRAVD